MSDARPSVESTWRPLFGEPEPEVFTEKFDTLDAAKADALRLACCSGVTSVRVTDELGVTRFTWDREDNLFRTISEEAAR